MEYWIYDLVQDAIYYEVYDNPDNTPRDYAWVTIAMVEKGIEDCTQYLIESGELPISNPSWQDEEMAHLMVLDWMGSYFG